MQNADRLDSEIKRCLAERAEGIEADQGLKNRVMADIRRQKKEDVTMKKWSVKRIVLVAAALTLVGSAAVYAGSRIVAYTGGHSSISDETSDYGEAVKISEGLGYDLMAGLPESFSNGFTFKSAVPGEGYAADEDHNVIGENYKTLMVTYADDAGREVTLNINRSSGGEEPAPDESREYDGCTLNYNLDNYLFTGTEEDVSEEDRAAEAAGELYISYGGEGFEEQRNVFAGVSWVKDGIFYHFSAFDTDLATEDFFTMAQEFIDNK